MRLEAQHVMAIAVAIGVIAGIVECSKAEAGVIATFKTYDESPYGYGVNSQSTMALWDSPGFGCSGSAYTVTDKTGTVTSSGCWSARKDGYSYTVILDGLGSIPGYLFEGTEYARRLHEAGGQ